LWFTGLALRSAPPPVERELGFEEHGYARHTPLPGMMGLMEEQQQEEGEDEEEEEAAHRQAHHHHHLHCKQCLLLGRRLEQEMHTSARLRKEVGFGFTATSPYLSVE